MYQTIYVPLDNSDHSNVSAELALSLSRQLGSRFVGSHAYAAALHDVRFKQMEFTLPDEYKDETELEKQRRIHDSLIARGLTLISDSYLDVWARRADEIGVPFEGKRFDGKNFEVIVKDIEGSDYDLVILGALGQGAVRDSEVGSVCERVLRRVKVDTLVVRDLESAAIEATGPGARTIAVCIDGSAASLRALDAAAGLAVKVGKHLDIVAVCEPGSDEGAIGRELDAARRQMRERGIGVSATMLDGQPIKAILAHLERTRPWMVVVGRTGADADGDAGHEVGSISERLVRRAPCNVLIASGTAARA